MRTVLKGSVARNTLWMSIGQGARLAIQAAYFTLMARSLGVRNYGTFLAALSLVGVFYPFGVLGRGNLLVQSVARDKTAFAKMWGQALATIAASGPLFVGAVILLSRYALPPSIPTLLVVLVALADIVGLNVALVSGQAFQSFDLLNWTAVINVLTSAVRLGGALVMYSLYRSPTALQWGYTYFASTAVVAAVSCWLACAKLGRPQLALWSSWRETREGLYFSVSLGAQTIYNDIDKMMLARLSTLAATGIYGAAYRIIDVSFSPISALLYAAYPGFFRKGAAGLGSSLAYARKLLTRAIGYAALVGCALLIGAGLVPYVLGRQYADTAEALRWLAPLPMLKACHYFVSDALSGAGHQNIRCSIQLAVALVNIFINLWIIPRYSWRGAAWSSIASDGLLAVSMGLCALALARVERVRNAGAVATAA